MYTATILGSDAMGLDNYGEPVVAEPGFFSKNKVMIIPLSAISAAASGFHGMRRNNGSIGWGIVWFLLGATFPILTPVVGVAQGFAKPIVK
jgi:hypothetical protein